MTIQQKRNESMRLLNPFRKHHINCVAINAGNTKEHEMKKAEQTYELIKCGYEVVTEAIFKNGCRADIYILDTNHIIEILHSETLKNAKEKTRKYPVPAENIIYCHA